MTYGLPPITNAATNTTPQSPHNADSVTTERRFTLNPEATPFVPRNQGVSQWNTPIDIKERQATTCKKCRPGKVHRRGGEKKYPDETVKRINDAYEALKTQKFSLAEGLFRTILHIDKNILKQYDYQKMHIGLARSLNKQTREKQEEACSCLEKLRSNAPLNEFGTSTIHNLDLTLSLCEEALGRYIDAERRLLRLRNKKHDANEETWCEPSDDFDADIANARLWQTMKKHKLGETLLLKLQAELTIELQSCRSTAAAKKRHKCLRTINLTLALIWQDKGKYEWTEDLLLKMSGKQPDDIEEIQCKPCEHHEINLILSRHWEVMGKYNRAERLLLNMSDKPPDASEDILCKPSGHHDIDLALVRHWEVLGKFHLSERLLLNLSGMDPRDTEETLCQPCGHHDFDLARARLWQVMDKPERTEKLLLNMSGKHHSMSEETLCKPSGKHDIDLALVRLWEVVGQLERAERLLRPCRELYHSSEFEYALLRLCAGREGFMEMLRSYPESAYKMQAVSIHYFSLACEQIIKDGLKSGKDNLKKALESAEATIEKYPHCAGAYSQKAHCLRMGGASEQEWRKYFDKACFLDQSRAYKGKTDSWRSSEAAALEIQGLTI
ncbi:hypothetical protein [Endozoicomonas sp. 8E]|uniref:hypothetical protein n=1 Tax=Endozoicomonas sp. 8E TaxID=3035692 RepID=UPI002938DF80|nr:hypothetical protein [Endozoicomonas sp. 8E]WOG26246.1 hypothetical protein P6910_16970 [Endozoicomonas sp. 8E]